MKTQAKAILFVVMLVTWTVSILFMYVPKFGFAAAATVLMGLATLAILQEQDMI